METIVKIIVSSELVTVVAVVAFPSLLIAVYKLSMMFNQAKRLELDVKAEVIDGPELN